MTDATEARFDEGPSTRVKSAMMKQRLVDATIRVLASDGYQGATIQKICAHTGVSNGGLFRHYATREMLMGDVALELGRRVAREFEAVRTVALTDEPGLHPLTDILRHVRGITRSELGAAWREVLTASRHSPLMAQVLSEPIHAVKDTALHHVTDVTGLPPEHPLAREAMVVIITVLHAFNGEAMSGPQHTIESNQEIRLQWLARVLGDALVRASEAAMSESR